MTLTRRAALLGPAARRSAAAAVFENIFGDTKTPIPGKREAVLASTARPRGRPGDRRPVVGAAAARRCPDWPQAGGTPTHVVGNVAVSGLQPAWRVRASARAAAIARRSPRSRSSPAAACSRWTATARSPPSTWPTGSRQWRTDTQGEKDRSTNLGGGIAASAARRLRHHRPRRGARRSTPAPARSSGAGRRLAGALRPDRWPRASCSSPRSTTGCWRSTPPTARASGPTRRARRRRPCWPARRRRWPEGFVVAGFGSGDLVTVRADSGVLAWSDSLASARGRNSLVDLSAIRALAGDRPRPGLCDRDRRAAGLARPALRPPAVGARCRRRADALARRRLACSCRRSTKPWPRSTPMTAGCAGCSDLPRWDDPEKQKDPIFWTGPVLADGKLVLAGTDGRRSPSTRPPARSSAWSTCATRRRVAAAWRPRAPCSSSPTTARCRPSVVTRGLPVVVIAGRPNVGKSTLFNKLAGPALGDRLRHARRHPRPQGRRGDAARQAGAAGRHGRARGIGAGDAVRPHARLLRGGGGAGRPGRVRGRCALRHPARRPAFRRLAAPPGPAGAARRQQGRGPGRRVGGAGGLFARPRRAGRGLGRARRGPRPT